MSIAVIGKNGFVGSTLMRQIGPDAVGYGRGDIGEKVEERHDIVICAAAPGVKWKANAEPEADAAAIDALIIELAKFKNTKHFVLISTVDVYSKTDVYNQDEREAPNATEPYGSNRARLERFVEANLPNPLIVRLPGLVGPGLRKNALFDLKTTSKANVNPKSEFQFYPMVNLWHDVRRLLHCTRVNLCTDPISMEDVVSECFIGPEAMLNHTAPLVMYDMRSIFGVTYDETVVKTAIRSYFQG